MAPAASVIKTNAVVGGSNRRCTIATTSIIPFETIASNSPKNDSKNGSDVLSLKKAGLQDTSKSSLKNALMRCHAISKSNQERAEASEKVTPIQDSNCA